MQKGTIIRGSLIIIIVLMGALALLSTTNISKDSTSKESMEECAKKKPSNPNTNMIWESLSHQFFTSSDASY